MASAATTATFSPPSPPKPEAAKVQAVIKYVRAPVCAYVHVYSSRVGFIACLQKHNVILQVPKTDNRLPMTVDVWADPSTHPASQLGYAKLRALLQARPNTNMRCTKCLGVGDEQPSDQYEVYRYTDLQSNRYAPIHCTQSRPSYIHPTHTRVYNNTWVPAVQHT